MTALYWVLGILAALAALLVLLRLRVTLSYGEEGPGLAVALGPVTVLRLPLPKGKKPPRTKRLRRSRIPPTPRTPTTGDCNFGYHNASKTSSRKGRRLFV